MTNRKEMLQTVVANNAQTAKDAQAAKMADEQLLARVRTMVPGPTLAQAHADAIRKGYPRTLEYLEARQKRAARTEKRQPAAPTAPVHRGLVCPHCGEVGQVYSEAKKVKRGISGGKATGALLTGGISLLGTGLSRKVAVTARHCSACGSNWTVS